MGFLQQLREALFPATTNRPTLLVDGDPADPFSFDIVGEAPRQPALWNLVSGFARIDGGGYEVEVLATLVREPWNPHDSNAIAVKIDRRLVGYIPRDEAADLAPQLDRLGGNGNPIVARGVIVGGFPLSSGGSANLGVKLGIVAPAGSPTAARREPQATEERGASAERSTLGFHDGKHYTEYVEDVKALKRHGALDEASALLLQLIDAVEAEADAEASGVAPWYYEHLPIVRRKQKDYRDEVEILERYAERSEAPGAGPDVLRARLDKAREKLERSPAG